MKKILINEKNAARIESALEEANGRAKVRTVATYKEVVAALAGIEEKFKGIQKKHLDGLSVTYTSGAARFPGAYKWVPEGTRLLFENSRGKWYLAGVCRADCRGGSHYAVRNFPKQLAGEILHQFTFFDAPTPEIRWRDRPVKNFKSYKDFKSEYIGGSDIASLKMNGIGISFGGDGEYTAYIVEQHAGEFVEIGAHYERVADFRDKIEIFDDSGKTAEYKADFIRVYRAGAFGCIIQLING